MLKALIVEDDPRHAATLQSLLRQAAIQVDVLGVCANVATAAEAIRTQNPDLIFLDIDLEWGENGFDLLALFPDPTFAVIFTTQHTSTANAISAIRASALDFLPKPVLRQELETALAKVNPKETAAQLQTLRDNVQSPDHKLKRFWLADTRGKLLIDVANVVYCKSANVWTHFHLAMPLNGKLLFTSSESIKEWEKIFAASDILRIHNQYLVNLNYLAKYHHVKGNSSFLLANGEEVPISRSRKDDVEARLEAYRKGG